jgi:hypothetical protein
MSRQVSCLWAASHDGGGGGGVRWSIFCIHATPKGRHDDPGIRLIAKASNQAEGFLIRQVVQELDDLDEELARVGRNGVAIAVFALRDDASTVSASRSLAIATDLSPAAFVACHRYGNSPSLEVGLNRRFRA